MGITGLLPFLEKSSKRTKINEFAGGTVAIDTYCWLHKGAFCCADKLSMGQSTDAYVHYCMKFIHMLLSYKIKPILVFDGKHLPAKAQTEAKRREARQTNRRKAIELMRMGQHAEGRNLLRRSIDVTHEMALELIKECHKMNIDCIVAPYEADAQLAYLNISGIVDVVITEDSDLTLFGCKKIFFKMDVNGNGLLVDQERIHLAMGVRSEDFNMDNFRHMCILSGCDYLSSLPGIGLSKARKFITINTDCDIHRALSRLGSYLNMKSLVVTKEYRDAFILAVITFKHQLVYCPLRRKQVRLTPPTADVTEEQLYYAGKETDPNIALQLALGNCDPFTLKILHNFNPDNIENQFNKRNTWGQKSESLRHVSIWSKEYKMTQKQLESPQERKFTVWPATVGKEATFRTNRLKKVILQKQQDNFEHEQLNQKEILNIYETKNTMDIDDNSEVNTCVAVEDTVSPVLIRRTNPFSRQSSTKTSPSLLLPNKSRIKGRNMMRIRRTIIDEKTVTESKFFSKLTAETNNVPAISDNESYLTTDTHEMSIEKENMESESNSINLQASVITDKEKMNLYPMDTDEENSISPLSNEYKDVERLSTSNCNLEKSHLNVSVNDSFINICNLNTSHDLTTSLTSSDLDIDSDFLFQRDINALNDSLFKWSDPNTSVQINGRIKQNKNSPNSKKLVNSKTNTTNSARRSQRLCSVQKQQNLLSMYGFEKKSKLIRLILIYYNSFPY
ncbi:Exonuclease 1 [Anthophora plagiata]